MEYDKSKHMFDARKEGMKMAKRVIFHIDVNSAFLSWEAVYRLRHLGGKLDLRTIPSAVGGDISKRHGIILAKSIPAKKYNLQTGEPVTDALKKCPNLYLVPPNYSMYEKNSRAMMKTLREYSPAVEIYSIDEAFADMSGMEALYGPPMQEAHTIKDRIRDELGFTVNVGVSSNKLLAKMASDFKKPDRVHTLFPEEVEKKMWRLPVRDLFFVGAATENKLKKLGIRTIGELAESDPAMLRYHLKKQGEVIWQFANGIDTGSVIPTPPPNKGYGNSTTISFDVQDTETAKKVLLSLSETIGRRIREDRVQIQVVSVGIRYYDFSYASHQRKLDEPTDVTNEIYAAACQIFAEMWNGWSIRHIGIHTSGITEQGGYRQMSLFGDEAEQINHEKLSRMDKAVDDIRKRFGADAVKRAVFLDDDRIDHLSGGISREKRTVDYSKLDVK